MSITGYQPPKFASRRRFLTTAAAAPWLALPRPALSLPPAYRGNPLALSGTDFQLDVGEHQIRATSRSRPATLVQGSLPGPTLRWREGDDVTIRVRNRLDESTSIHWHGLLVPPGMDGVPGVSFPGIAPGETFTYRFRVRQNGTYWYHSHSGFQEQTGVYGALIIDPAGPERFPVDRDHVMVLSDWTDDDPHRVYNRLKRDSEFYLSNRRTLGDLVREVRERGLGATRSDRAMWGQMRMSDRDISDVTGAEYTFLMNGASPDPGASFLANPGERVRLRVINAAAMTYFDLRIPGLSLRVIAVDGQPVEPVTVDELRIGVAETYDILVEPKDAGPYPVFAQAIDRSGFAFGSLGADPAARAEPPAMDPPTFLTHADMGMAPTEDHAAHGAPAEPAAPMMDHGEHAGHAMPMQGGEHAGHAMPAQHGAHGGNGNSGAHTASAPAPVRNPVALGPGVDMRVDFPKDRLDDPGAGLRNNGRRVLTYADLTSTEVRPADPDREIELHLTGSMWRYLWSFDGIPRRDAPPMRFREGERVRMVLINDTGMNHPIHLHGMWSDVETGGPAGGPDGVVRKHTVSVQPASRVRALVHADAPGPWAFHCHLLYHMPGMFREVHVGEV